MATSDGPIVGHLTRLQIRDGSGEWVDLPLRPFDPAEGFRGLTPPPGYVSPRRAARRRRKAKNRRRR